MLRICNQKIDDFLKKYFPSSSHSHHKLKNSNFAIIFNKDEGFEVPRLALFGEEGETWVKIFFFVKWNRFGDCMGAGITKRNFTIHKQGPYPNEHFLTKPMFSSGYLSAVKSEWMKMVFASSDFKVAPKHLKCLFSPSKMFHKTKNKFKIHYQLILFWKIRISHL